MSNDFRSKSAMMDHLLKQTRLVAQVSIDSNATPASKVHGSDIPGVLFVRSEGKTAEADAVEDISGLVTAPVDATGKFAILLDEADLDKFYVKSVSADVGSISVVASGLTPEGRIYIDLDSDQTLASQDLVVTVQLDFKRKK